YALQDHRLVSDNQPPPLNLRHDLQLSLVEQAEALLKQREPLDSCWILPNSFSKIKHIYISYQG
ncbi:hypothetical protein, partial [Shigella sonnei]|uniref:hypothetical protein n=1 Tax=Shigella sonnei TaxID=624 RepID=UPI000A500365